MNCMFRVGLVPGLKSVARATAAPAAMSLRAGGYRFNPRWKFAPGKSVATTFGACQGANIRGRKLVEMVGGGRAKLDAEARGAGAGKLLGVNPWHQAELAACVKHAAAVFHAERAAVAEAVDEFRQFLSPPILAL